MLTFFKRGPKLKPRFKVSSSALARRLPLGMRIIKYFCPTLLLTTTLLMAAPLPAAAVDEVTVQARREHEALRKEVNTFVSAAFIRAPFDESLLRWEQPVCPLVAGLSKAGGEFILSRLSAAGRDAKVPLAGEQCRPNLFVIFAKHPREFLTLWWRRSPGMYNTYYGIQPVKTFIEKDRPIRVWYNTQGMSEEASDISGLLASSANITGEGEYPIIRGPAAQLGSHLRTVVARSIDSAIIVVDVNQVNLQVGQLADYLSMVSFAEINQDTDLGNAPSILKVFASPTDALSAMSPWDKALLESLYTTRHFSRLQLATIQSSTLKLIETK